MQLIDNGVKVSGCAKFKFNIRNLEGGTTVAVRDLIVKTKELQKANITNDYLFIYFYLLTFATHTIQLYFMYKILTEKIQKRNKK